MLNRNKRLIIFYALDLSRVTHRTGHNSKRRKARETKREKGEINQKRGEKGDDLNRRKNYKRVIEVAVFTGLETQKFRKLRHSCYWEHSDKM